MVRLEQLRRLVLDLHASGQQHDLELPVGAHRKARPTYHDRAVRCADGELSGLEIVQVSS
jgi:hypothetical protein